MSAFVTTARVRSPVLLTCLDIRMDSQVVKSTVADRTLRMMDSCGLMYFIIILEICSYMFSGCPLTGTRVIPGRSTIVRSGTPFFFTWSVKGVSETPLPDPASQVCIKINLILIRKEKREAKHTSDYISCSTDSFSDMFLIGRNDFVAVIKPDLRFSARTSLESHNKRNPRANSLSARQTDSCQ